MLRTKKESGRHRRTMPEDYMCRSIRIQMCPSISGIRVRLARTQQWNHSAKTNDIGTTGSAVNNWRTINSRLTASNGFFSIGIYYTWPSFNFQIVLQCRRCFEQNCSVDLIRNAGTPCLYLFCSHQLGPKFEIKLLVFYGDRLWWFLSSHWVWKFAAH